MPVLFPEIFRACSADCFVMGMSVPIHVPDCVVCAFPIDDRPGTFHGVFLGTALVALCQAGNGERAENQRSWTTVGPAQGARRWQKAAETAGRGRGRTSAKYTVMANRMT